MKNGVWSSYVDRLEMYFKVNDVKDGLKLPTLIAVMGDEAYELLVNLASPKKPADLDYTTAVELLKDHLQPAPSALAERYRFRLRKQGPDENIATYIAELKKLARNCKFDSNLNENLRDQFVCGMKSDIIRQRLFAEDDALTFAKAVKIASSLEAAERDSAAVDAAGRAGIGQSTAETAGVYTIAAGSGRRGQSHARRGGGGRGARGAYATAAAAAGRGGGGASGLAWRNTANDSRRYCRGCGADNHEYGNCRFRNYECSRCRQVGHLRRVCPAAAVAANRASAQRGGGGRAAMHYAEAEAEMPSDEYDGMETQQEDFHHLNLNDYSAVSVPVSIEGIVIQMEVDTGSAVSCVNEKTYNQNFRHLTLDTTNLNLKFYDGSSLVPLGVIKPEVCYNGKKNNLELFVIQGGTTSLLGRQWLTELNIGIPKFSNCHKLGSNSQMELNVEINNLLHRFEELFTGGLGRYSAGKASLRLREGAVPVFHRARPVPYALRERIDAELDRMLRDGVIEQVDCSDWASPLVPVSKADGSLRICADYKNTLNPCLYVDRYPLPRIDDLIVRLSGAQYFSKIDLSQAYNQIELDELSKCYTVINTHRGLYRYNRLVYGLSSSAGIFQRTMCNLFKDIPNVEVFLDDVIIGGKDKVQHLKALEAVFSRLEQYGLRLKKDKCVFLVNEVQYLGYVISREGIKTDPRKIEAITKIPRPSNTTEVRSFLGMVNFYSKFVNNMSARLVPLYNLLKRGVNWYWSKECERAFIEIKNILTSADVLAHYDPSKPLTLTCDASARGVGGVLTQPAADGRGERPVAYVSRTLNDAEKNYSQIHKEALAIIFCVQKYHQYLYGRKFQLRTDHKPLVSIFGPHKGIPTMVASRMQRWAIILSAYTFDIEYIRTDNNIADGLSRLPVPVSKQVMSHALPEQTYLHFISDELLLDYNEIKRETMRDPLLMRVLSYIRDGWPATCEIANMQPYYNRRAELYEELGCVMWGHRLVIPEKCKDRVLQLLHEPHMGIVKSKAMARSYVWWAGVDEAVERVCRGCAVCAAQADAPPRQAPSPWPWPSQPWSRIHLDFMGPIQGVSYLVVVDARTKWLEVFGMTSTTAGAVIDKLSELFSRWGLPKQIVTDNGTAFTSSELRDFTRGNGIQHIFTAPYHPASNGLAENAVRTLKRVIKKAILGKEKINKALWSFLLHYRNTAHSTTNESPAKLMLGRPLRTKLDVLKPDREGVVSRAQQRQRENAGGADRKVNSGEQVWYRQYLKGEKWAPGQVVECLGPSDYKLRGSRGEVIHRHIDQLKRRSDRQSLEYATPNLEVDNESSTNSELEPSVLLSDRETAEHPPSGSVTPPPANTESSSLSKSPHSGTACGTEPGGSPVFLDALPADSPSQPQTRPVRQCRVNKVPRYKF